MKMEIPKEIKEAIEAKASEMFLGKYLKYSRVEIGGYGYSLAMQEIEELRKENERLKEENQKYKERFGVFEVI